MILQEIINIQHVILINRLLEDVTKNKEIQQLVSLPMQFIKQITDKYIEKTVNPK